MDRQQCVLQMEKIGAILDRNGLRPSRYLVTDDGTVLLSSEMGVLPIEPSSVKKDGGYNLERFSS